MSISLDELSAKAKGQPAIQPTSDSDEQEVSRLSQRQSVRRRIAELTLRAEQAAELRRVIAAINGKSDAAAEQHRIATAPLQSELSELHEKQLDEITGKQTPDADDAKRRQELLQQLADANSELEKVVQANKTTIRKVETQISELMPQPGTENFNITTLENQLCGALATQEQQDRHWMLSEKIKWAKARRDAAQKMVAEFLQIIDIGSNPEQWHGGVRINRRDVTRYQTRMRRWQLEAADGERCFADARAESEKLRRQCLEQE